MGNKECIIVNLSYNTGMVSILHKKNIKQLMIGIRETVKQLKCSCLNDTSNCETCSKKYLDYRPCEFEEVLNEIHKVAIVGLYHIWERNLKELLICGANPKHDNTANCANLSFQQIRTLFEADSTNREGLQRIFDALEKYSLLTNAIKHGLGRSMKLLQDTYPQYFYNETNKGKLLIIDGEKCYEQIAIEPLVTENDIEDLYNNLMEFWDKVPKQLTFSSELLEKRNLRSVH